MHTFTDNVGRVWSLSVNVATIKRVRALCGVDLANIIDIDDSNNPSFNLLERLSTDPVLLVDVLYAVCKLEAEQKNVDDESFASAILGDVMPRATDALLEEMIDFFPSSKRLILRQLLALNRRFEQEIDKKTQELLNEENLLKAEEELINSFTNVPVSAE